MYDFPYTNFHELNLDWILKKIEDLRPSDNVNSIYNVKYYGAIGDGVTDDYPAIMAAINSIESPGYIYFPPGEYLCSQKIEAENISFIGAGKQVTFITFDDCDGFDLTQTNVLNTTGTGCIEIANMTIWQDSAGHTAIKISGQYPGDRTTQAPVIHDVKIMGYHADVYNKYWNDGIVIDSCNGAVIFRCSITGGVNSNEPNYFSSRAILLDSSLAPRATDYIVSDCFINYWNYALYSTIYEGLHFINNSVVGCYNGLRLNGANKYPLVIISDCHFNTAYYSIWLSNVKEIIITNNSLYHQLVPTGIANGYGVYAKDCDSINISNCQLMNLATNNMFGIELDNCDVFSINNNIMRNQGSGTLIRAVNLVSCTNGILSENLSTGSFSDDGANTLVNNITIQ